MPSLVVGPGLVDGPAELVTPAADFEAEAVPPAEEEAGGRPSLAMIMLAAASTRYAENGLIDGCVTDSLAGFFGWIYWL